MGTSHRAMRRHPCQGPGSRRKEQDNPRLAAKVIVSMIRGTPQQDIAAQTGIPRHTVGAIVQRNPELVAEMEAKMRDESMELAELATEQVRASLPAADANQASMIRSREVKLAKTYLDPEYVKQNGAGAAAHLTQNNLTLHLGPGAGIDPQSVAAAFALLQRGGACREAVDVPIDQGENK